jgi:hypothetical protein
MRVAHPLPQRLGPPSFALAVGLAFTAAGFLPIRAICPSVALGLSCWLQLPQDELASGIAQINISVTQVPPCAQRLFLLKNCCKYQANRCARQP